MLPPSLWHSLEQEGFTASDRPLGTLIHTHIYLLPVCVKCNHKETRDLQGAVLFTASVLHNTGLTASSKALFPAPAPGGRFSRKPQGLCLPLPFYPLTKLCALKAPSLFNLPVTLNNNPITALNPIQDVHLHPPF